MTKRDFQETALIHEIIKRGPAPDPADLIQMPGETAESFDERQATATANRAAYRDSLIDLFQFAGFVHDNLPP